MVRVFFCEPTGKVQRSLRRYSHGECKGSIYNFHNASVNLDVVDDVKEPIGDRWPHDDPRWPNACEHCGQPFVDADNWQLFQDPILRRTDTGATASWRDMPVGAVRDLPWMHDQKDWCGPDGRSLLCKTPGGEWMIDSRANNCTMPDENVHKCWVRHGKPEDGNLHVDKNGHTCSAGAGSIATRTWHGFLHNGTLVTA